MVATTMRQRLVPDRPRDRMGSVYSLLVMGAGAVGAVVGGALAERSRLTGPFWVAVVRNVFSAAARGTGSR